MENNSLKKKILLMGASGSGKTSMRSIIFANYVPRDTTRLAFTVDVETSHVRFLGNLVLNLWDCGGQDKFMENYFSSQKTHIFRNVAVLIYVFDVMSTSPEKDTQQFLSCMESVRSHSPDAAVFCLMHKMDLIPEDQRDMFHNEKDAVLKEVAFPSKITTYRTSIWDETLFKAWSQIVYSLIPNIQKLETNLRKFATVCEADEVVVFERETFLVICTVTRVPQMDTHRMEKISNIVKQFKLSCSKSKAQFHNMEVRNTSFSSFMDVFTPNTYVMMVVSDPEIPSSIIKHNLQMARPRFSRWINGEERPSGV
eukprot:TRINITY_DN1130_c2_g1_i1.p1 TRINITY_DN1130_c2_g1~~TRINITY_DN1130_c2_g1_i1.p1  ORF type:complete len:311 (+),score=85.58 TRINITY_DN1130_c2_g1_i1:175-1107(+)